MGAWLATLGGILQQQPMRMESRKRAIDKIYKRRHRYDIPDWQRQEVWARSKKQNLIDTMLRRWKLPKFYFLKVSDDPESYEVVDGQQRLVTIFEFFDNQLPLAPQTAADFRGQYYRELPDDVSDAFDDYEIEFDEIENATDEDVKDFFQRLQDGLPLTSAEKLNSVHSHLRDFVSAQSAHPFFNKTGTSNRRYGHFDILAKVMVIEIDGIEVGLRFDDIRAVFKSQSTFSVDSNVAKRLVQALEFVNIGFDAAAGGSLRNRTIVQSLLTLVCTLLRSGEISGEEDRIKSFFLEFLRELDRQIELGNEATDSQYLEFQRTVSANIKGGPKIRQRILLRKLIEAAPDFAFTLGSDAILAVGVKELIEENVTCVSKIIAQTNSVFAAKHGVDLFKFTNKTFQAFERFKNPICGFDAYKSFVDDLYFVFHEGVGTRLQGKTPDSFGDVNTLRTDLRHDLDHGAKGKSKAKRRRIGATFAKYGGASSPELLAPGQFVLFQVNLLSALKRDLQQLNP